LGCGLGKSASCGASRLLQLSSPNVVPQKTIVLYGSVQTLASESHYGPAVIRRVGPSLDGEVARRLGESGPRIPPYSTDEAAADELTARLEERGLFATCESSDGVWYATLWLGAGEKRERLATGSGETRPSALSRAVVNLPAERLLGQPSAAPKAAAGGPTDSADPPFEKGLCQGCGVPLPIRGRTVPRYCPVCSYRLTKPAQIAFEAESRSPERRRRRRKSKNSKRESS